MVLAQRSAVWEQDNSDAAELELNEEYYSSVEDERLDWPKFFTFSIVAEFLYWLAWISSYVFYPRLSKLLK